jgi:hypothetical protein
MLMFHDGLGFQSVFVWHYIMVAMVLFGITSWYAYCFRLMMPLLVLASCLVGLYLCHVVDGMLTVFG